MRAARLLPLLFLLVFIVPLATHAAWWSMQGMAEDWRRADWSSAKLLPAASTVPEATVHVFAARVGRPCWRNGIGVTADHCPRDLQNPVAEQGPLSRRGPVGLEKAAERNGRNIDSRQTAHSDSAGGTRVDFEQMGNTRNVLTELDINDAVERVKRHEPSRSLTYLGDVGQQLPACRPGLSPYNYRKHSAVPGCDVNAVLMTG
jgi:hypothetical protein